MTAHTHPLGIVERLGDEVLGDLADGLRGDLILPDHEAYEDARNVWNGLVNTYPAVVVRVKGATDVARAVGFARDQGLELAIRGGAHHEAGSAVVENGLVVDLADLDSVHVDPDEQVARVEPGTRAEDILAETQQHGLACPTGSAGDVGTPGSTLGGGIGWIRRKHGLAVDALRAVEVVTADGRLLKATRTRNENLFWAVRGGGGNFGVVTSFEFDLFEVGPLVQGLGVFYPAAAAEEVMQVHRDVMLEAPDELTTILLHGHVPGLPPMPDDLVGTDAIGILGCYAGDHERGAETVAPLRDVADPLIDLSDVMPYELLHDLGTQMFPWGRNYCHRSVFVDELSDERIDILLERTEAAPSPLSATAVWPMGGAVGSGPEAAFAWADKRYMITVEANWEDHDTPANLEWARETERQLRATGAEGAYAGFTGVEECDWEDWTAQVYGDGRERLARVKAAFDPENVFRHNVNVEPGESR